MSSSFQIVPAEERHVPLILRLITALAEYERLAHECVATEADLRKWLFGPRPAAEALLAFEGDVPVGFALFFQTFSTFLGRPGIHLEDLFVLPEWRGRGVGRELLRHLAARAVDQDLGRVEWTVLDWNKPSIDFYRRLGAQPMNEWILYRLTGDALARFASTTQV